MHLWENFGTLSMIAKEKGISASIWNQASLEITGICERNRHNLPRATEQIRPIIAQMNPIFRKFGLSIISLNPAVCNLEDEVTDFASHLGLKFS